MLNFLHLKNVDIFKQLQLEESLLKNSQKSFCIINEGTKKSLVLGILNKENEWIDLKKAKKAKIQIVKRFSAGGSVFVDENTIFVTFIFSKNFLNIKLFPEPIMRWAFSFYKKVFSLKDFNFIENDFVIKNKKIAGNAQYIKKDRFLLHSSFLWDFNENEMNKYLLFPQKKPQYRKNRSHSEFLTTLKKEKKFSKQKFLRNIKDELFKNFEVQEKSFKNFSISEKEFSTKLL